MKIKLYDNTFFETTIRLLEDEIHNLSNWSVHNDDEFNEEVYLLQKTLDVIIDLKQQSHDCKLSQDNGCKVCERRK